MPRAKLSMPDFVCLAAVLLLALLLFWSPWQGTEKGELLLICTPDGQQEYALNRDRTVTVSSRGIDMVIVIENGAAYVLESKCPDGVCRAGAPISHSGETILCAPAGVRLTVKGGEKDVDFVAG